MSISSTAAFGPRQFRLVLPNDTIYSGDVTFTVTPPRITSINDSGLFGPVTRAEVAPGTSGLIRFYGPGLNQVMAVRFSGEGVTGTLESNPQGLVGLYMFIDVRLTVSPSAPLGDRDIELVLANDRTAAGSYMARR